MVAAFSTQPAVGDKATAVSVDNLMSNEVLNDSGTTAITPSAANTATTLAVAFNKTFPSAPRVFCQFATGVTGTVTCFVWPTAATTSGFTLNINRSSTTTTTVFWFAVITQ